MPGFVLHVDASAICPHGGQISYITSNVRVSVGNEKVVTSRDVFPIAGCVFNIASAPHPCVNMKWIVPATRILINGQPALLSNSVGLCQSVDLSPQGPPSIIVTQLRVKGM